MIIINPKNNQVIKLNTSLAKEIIKNYILYIKMKNTTYQCKKIKNSKSIKKKTNKTKKTKKKQKNWWDDKPDYWKKIFDD